MPNPQPVTPATLLQQVDQIQALLDEQTPRFDRLEAKLDRLDVKLDRMLSTFDREERGAADLRRENDNLRQLVSQHARSITALRDQVATTHGLAVVGRVRTDSLQFQLDAHRDLYAHSPKATPRR